MQNAVCGFAKMYLYPPPKNAANNLSFICNPCKNKTDDPSDNIWHQFSPLDDYFEEAGTVSSDERAYFDPDKINYTDNCKMFNHRGLRLIHLNMNSILYPKLANFVLLLENQEPV